MSRQCVNFGYTAFSKLLEYEKFIFQLRLAPAPFIVRAAPVLARLVPVVEFLESDKALKAKIEVFKIKEQKLKEKSVRGKKEKK